jgi:hypothetical protein
VMVVEVTACDSQAAISRKPGETCYTGS